MKKRSSKALLLITLATAFLVGFGCYSGGNDDDDSPETSTTTSTSAATTVQLEIGVPFEVNTGDQLVPDSSDTRIRVEHTLNSTKQVTLLAGGAQLIRGNAQVM